MKHKSFKTTKNKLFELYNESENNTTEIIQKRTNQDVVKLQVNQLNLKNFVINTHLDIDTGFEIPEYVTVEIEDEEREFLSSLKKSWDIDLGIIPLKFIPYIKTNIIIKNGEDESEIADKFQLGFGSISTNQYFDIEDIEGNDELKKVRALVSIYILSNPELLELEQRLPFYTTKLNIFLQNPSEFI